MFAFAWVASPVVAFDSVTHGIEGEVMFSVQFGQEEGDFATAQVEVLNPREGLLAPGRPLWAWLSYRPEAGGAFVPFMLGRIVGVPADINGEIITIELIARPADYDAQKTALANSLRVFPYYDPIWFDEAARLDPDTVLEGYSALWHIDPVTHVVSISDIVLGEDGGATLNEADVFVDSVKVSYGSAPIGRIEMQATVSWNQQAKGNVALHPAIPAAGINGLNFNTYTGQGLIDKWPKPGASIGGGWKVGIGSGCTGGGVNDEWYFDTSGFDGALNRANKFGKDVVMGTDGKYYDVAELSYDKDGLARVKRVAATANGNPRFSPPHRFFIGAWTMTGTLFAEYDVSRAKTEVVSFALEADTQSVLTDSTDNRIEVMAMQSSEVVAPLDNGDVTPIASPWARSFLPTARGTQSIEFLIRIARARLLASARCVDVSCEMPFELGFAKGLTLRQNIALEDAQLPGGIAAGKIKSYSFSATGDGDTVFAVSFACSIGRDGDTATTPGEPSYANDGYMADGYQRRANVFREAGGVAFRSIEGQLPDDDGIDFDRMTAARVTIEPLRIVSGTFEEQTAAIKEHNAVFDVLAGLPEPAPSVTYEEVNAVPTTFGFRLKPLTTGPFATQWQIETTPLRIPRTIDLEAESTP